MQKSSVKIYAELLKNEMINTTLKKAHWLLLPAISMQIFDIFFIAS